MRVSVCVSSGSGKFKRNFDGRRNSCSVSVKSCQRRASKRASGWPRSRTTCRPTRTSGRSTKVKQRISSCTLRTHTHLHTHQVTAASRPSDRLRSGGESEDAAMSVSAAFCDFLNTDAHVSVSLYGQFAQCLSTPLKTLDLAWANYRPEV